MAEWACICGQLVCLVVELAILAKSADVFVEGAVGLARKLHLSPLIVGFVIVGFGTSAPELCVSMLSAAQGAPMLALGNAYGSNVVNVLLILGVSMLIAPVAIHRGVFLKDLPFLLVMTVLMAAMALDGRLSVGDGLVLIGAFLPFLVYRIWDGRREVSPVELPEMTLRRAAGYTVGGLAALLAASQFLVWSASWLALRLTRLLGMDAATAELITGLTVVATGTSLPELMASVAAMRKGFSDVALGNIVGSNCFNLCIVAGMALAIHPLAVADTPATLWSRDVVSLLLSTLVLWLPGLALLAVSGRGRPVQYSMGWSRIWGWVLLAGWVGYLVWVIMGSL